MIHIYDSYIYDKLGSLYRACRECSRDRGPPARPPPARGGGGGGGGGGGRGGVGTKKHKKSKARNSLDHERPLLIFAVDILLSG